MNDRPVPEFISKDVMRGDYYFLNLATETAESLVVACGGEEVCGPSYVIRRTDFPYHSIEYVHNGTGTATLAGRSYALGPGMLFHYGPEIPHEITVRQDSHLDKFFIDFQGWRCDELLKVQPWDVGEPLHVSDPVRFRELFQQIQLTGRRQTPHCSEIAALLLEQLILLAADESVSVSESHSEAWNTYRNCREFIEIHCLELQTLSQIAELCGYTEAYICRVFRRFDKISPYSFLIKQKMSRAAALLQQSGFLVKDAAKALGMEDPYLFSKMFKRVHGVSPAEFRAIRHRQGDS